MHFTDFILGSADWFHEFIVVHFDCVIVISILQFTNIFITLSLADMFYFCSDIVGVGHV